MVHLGREAKEWTAQLISSPNTHKNILTNILQSTLFMFISSHYALPYIVSARDVVLRNTSYRKFTASDFLAAFFFISYIILFSHIFLSVHPDMS